MTARASSSAQAGGSGARDQALLQGICDAVTILVGAGVMDYNGHASMRDPAAGAQQPGFYINSGASDRAAMSPDQVCRVRVDAPDTLAATDGIRPPNEAHLHAAIYAARPDVAAVVHGHPMWSTLFTQTGTPLPLLMPQSALISDTPTYPHAHSISTHARGAAMADAMGQARGIYLAGHGSVFTGRGGDPLAALTEATALAIYSEQNAERAWRAALLGPATPLPPGDLDAHRANLDKPGLFAKCWAFHLSQGRHANVR